MSAFFIIMQKIIVKTTKMVFGGSCIAELDGKKIFIPYALPNETLEISITKEHKNYSEAKIVNIIEASPKRIEARCPYFNLCGGCNLQMANDEYQRSLRTYMAREALERAIPDFDKLYPIDDTKFIHGDAWNYRSRFQFHINKDKTYSQRKASSKELISLEDCPVAVEPIRKLFKQKANEKLGSRIHIFSDKKQIFKKENADNCSVELCGKKIQFNPLGFFQSNLEMTEKLLYTIFKDFKATKRILDFYSGVGTISLFATEYAEEIHLVEHNKHAHEYARLNFANDLSKKQHKPKIFYHTIDGENWTKKKESKLKFDIAFVDPPRSGIDKTSLKWFCESGIPIIYYVSCDPVSFARDTAKLIEEKYILEEHYLFDFYPQTHHVETLGIFKLKK